MTRFLWLLKGFFVPGWRCSCLFSVCGWFKWPSSGVVGFYDHEPSWGCSLWLRNCVWLWSVGCRNDPFVWWNTWSPDEWCSWPIVWVGCCCRHIGNSDHSYLSVVISMAQAVPNLCVSRKVFMKHQVNWNTVWGAIYRICPGVRFGLLTVLLRF